MSLISKLTFATASLALSVSPAFSLTFERDGKAATSTHAESQRSSAFKPVTGARQPTAITTQPVEPKRIDASPENGVTIRSEPKTPKIVEEDQMGHRIHAEKDPYIIEAKRAADPPPPPSEDEIAQGLSNGKTILLEFVEFRFDSNELTAAGKNEVAQLAQGLRGMPPGLIYEVVGNTDSKGAEAYNDALSLRRAKAVVDELVQQHQFSEDQFVAIGMGERDPIADNSTAEGRQRNRRVAVSASQKQG